MTTARKQWLSAEAEMRAAKNGAHPRNKFNAKRTFVDGITFDSKREANRYGVLKGLRDAGIVIRFLRQVPFDLPGGVKYRLDFLVWWADGRVTFEDVKGFKTQVYAIKKKQVEELYNLTIEEI